MGKCKKKVQKSCKYHLRMRKLLVTCELYRKFSFIRQHYIIEYQISCNDCAVRVQWIVQGKNDLNALKMLDLVVLETFSKQIGQKALRLKKSML